MNADDNEEEFRALAKLGNAIFGILWDEHGEVVREKLESVAIVGIVKWALPNLSEHQYRITSMRFGFGDFVGKPRTFEEIAEDEGITPAAVRRIMWAAVEYLRELVEGWPNQP